MGIVNSSRQEKEQLYIQKMTELQRIWKNPIDTDWEYVKEFTDEQLDKDIKDTIGQIRFEKTTGSCGLIFTLIGGAFVVLGVIGLLLFGIRQLF